MAGANSILPQPRQHVLAVSLEKCALIGARGVKYQMIKAQVDIMTRELDVNFRISGDA
jgi:hypothetical protein